MVTKVNFFIVIQSYSKQMLKSQIYAMPDEKSSKSKTLISYITAN